MKVLFVCIKNSARSVIAEAVFNSLAKKWRAESAGIQKGDKIDEKVREILEKEGLKAKELPRSVEEVNLNDYELVVTVCDEISCINLPAKNVLRWYIEDPAGKSYEAYKEVFNKIKKKVEELVDELENQKIQKN
ncbi:MAG: low molecular weight phosphatase family protein [Archaeoglobales archaeon]|nr:low molecular weight phosphatase family protein [Archaeoglobales archaeon]